MRKSALLFIVALPACDSHTNHLGNPLVWPIHAATNAVQNANYGQTRAQVEIFVKTNHPALIADLRTGGGATLTQAFDLAQTPAPVRAQHTLQMQSDLALYQSNLAALITAIMVTSDS